MKDNNKKKTTEREQYYLNAKEAKEHLLSALSFENVTSTYIFISEALAVAMTSCFYDDKEMRDELQDRYHDMKYILDCCLKLKEAEAFVELLESLEKQKSA